MTRGLRNSAAFVTVTFIEWVVTEKPTMKSTHMQVKKNVVGTGQYIAIARTLIAEENVQWVLAVKVVVVAVPSRETTCFMTH
jgi:hypothetical protein